MNRVRASMNEAPNQQVNLAHPIPVLIVYGTAIVTEDGIVHFYDDIYGHDASLEKVLANATDVQVDEVRIRIVAYTAPSQSESSLPQFERVDARHPQIDGFSLNM